MKMPEGALRNTWLASRATTAFKTTSMTAAALHDAGRAIPKILLSQEDAALQTVSRPAAHACSESHPSGGAIGNPPEGPGKLNRVGKQGGVYIVHTFRFGLACTPLELARIPHVFGTSHCFQGPGCSPSPTSGTTYSLGRDAYVLTC